MGCLYRIVNVRTGQCYIGQSAYSQPFTRFLRHKQEAREGSGGLLHCAMREDGEDQFECECLRQVPNDQLNALEAYYAEQYGSYASDGGYNERECGGAAVRREMSDATRMWIRRRAIWRQRGR
jgi:hypothetical protein